jgi:hypothetical protein
VKTSACVVGAGMPGVAAIGPLALAVVISVINPGIPISWSATLIGVPIGAV